MESVPTKLDEGKEAIQAVFKKVLATLKSIYGLELNNFESLRLWAYTKEAVERRQNDQAAGVNGFSPSSINPEMEALELFLTREFGVSTEDVHRVYELDMPRGATWQFKSQPEAQHTYDILTRKGHKLGISKTSKVVRDFKEYLKILQKRNRDGNAAI